MCTPSSHLKPLHGVWHQQSQNNNCLNIVHKLSNPELENKWNVSLVCSTVYPELKCKYRSQRLLYLDGYTEERELTLKNVAPSIGPPLYGMRILNGSPTLAVTSPSPSRLIFGMAVNKSRVQWNDYIDTKPTIIILNVLYDVKDYYGLKT